MPTVPPLNPLVQQVREIYIFHELVSRPEQVLETAIKGFLQQEAINLDLLSFPIFFKDDSTSKEPWDVLFRFPGIFSDNWV